MTTAVIMIASLCAAFWIAGLVANIVQERHDKELKRRLRERREMESRPHGWRY